MTKHDSKQENRSTTVLRSGARADICTMGIASLKALIKRSGLSTEDCVERSDLIRRAHQAAARLEQPQWTENKAGDEKTRALGQEIYDDAVEGKLDVPDFEHRAPALVEEAGGRDGFVKIFVEFYNRLFADDRMNVLFAVPKAELPPEEHGRRLATFILHMLEISDEYQRTPHEGFARAHQRSKRCPMRPKEHREAARFTVQQRAAWLGHLSLACDAVETPKELKDGLICTLAHRINMYGPFIEE